ncbi:hypothetical protein PR202_gb13793 [Eleusine coracana subsp. coracana]|uniref:Hexosyltransferase n=1 Tax=Eleusine coracana subsp. coracana TaxID=191504 RepID=A0AAV5ESW1_ELECO|nr:hypothetical protein PR202_gb13793 [Eleusine coracana subsp. coracana]
MGGVQKKMRNSSSSGHAKKVVVFVCACTVVVVVLVRGAHSCFVFVAIPPTPTSSSSPSEEKEMMMIPAPPYAAESGWEIEWESVAGSLLSSSCNNCNWSSSSGGNTISRVGVLNFNSREVARWRTTLPGAEVRAVRLAPVSDTITWEALYPVWIDEHSSSSCPSLPEPDHDPEVDYNYDLVAVKLPSCQVMQGWSRDVRRLHLQLSAAKLAVAAQQGSPSVLILSEGDCFPLPNLFPCKHLVARHGHAWLYRPDADYLRQRISLPIGSCQLASSSSVSVSSSSVSSSSSSSLLSSPINGGRGEAYATVLHSGDAYVCGAIVLAQSIRRSGSKRDLVALVDADGVGPEHQAGLAAAGWQVRVAARIRNPRASRHAYNEWNYSKFRLWQLTDYHKVVFLDADLLVLRNMDFLFAHHHQQLSATGNSGFRFNSGVMVLEPCNCTFDLLMSGIHRIHSYNGGDQGYLNEVFTWWHRLPRRANLLKYELVYTSTPISKQQQDQAPLALHYLGIKPWLCYHRHHDCNWDVPEMRRFASDHAHKLWWSMHDLIQPANLTHRFCNINNRSHHDGVHIEYNKSRPTY